MFNDDRPAIIFVCVHNAGRSQMAAGFLRAAAGDRVRVMSAGTEPKEYVNPVVVAVMQEIGIDISEGFPARLTNDDVVAADLCITMGCGDACPLVPGKHTWTGKSRTHLANPLIRCDVSVTTLLNASKCC